MRCIVGGEVDVTKAVCSGIGWLVLEGCGCASIVCWCTVVYDMLTVVLNVRCCMREVASIADFYRIGCR